MSRAKIPAPISLGVDLSKLNSLVWDVRHADFWETTRKFLNDEAVRTEHLRLQMQAAHMRSAQAMIVGDA